MKLKNLVASAFAVTLIAAPIYAGAATQKSGTGAGGTVCGRVDAPMNYIFQLQQSPTRDNVVVARSQSEEVQAYVHIDGSYCFSGLHTDVHTITAFEDAFPTLEATVTPVAGKTLIVDLTKKTGDL